MSPSPGPPLPLVATWWAALLDRRRAGHLVLGLAPPDVAPPHAAPSDAAPPAAPAAKAPEPTPPLLMAPGFMRRLLLAVVAMYATYGLCMGLYRGWLPAAAAAAKLPLLYLFTLAVCFPPLHVVNAMLGPGLTMRQTGRLLLVATSANAAALLSYAPVALFFSLTATRGDYAFILVMQFGVFGVATLLSILVIGVVFRGTAETIGRPLRPLFILGWSGLYALVLTQMSWALRPWIGSWGQPFEFLRARGGTFLENAWALVQRVMV